MGITPSQEEFVSRFKAYTANSSAYGKLSTYIKGLNARDVRDCLDIYFEVAKPYGGRDEHKRAVGVFYDLSLKALQSNDVYFALRFEALTQSKDLAWPKIYSELDSTQQRKLSSQVNQQKANLSLIQRGFMTEFLKHMDRPNQKAVSEYTAKLKKTDQLYDCLRVYVEVSQKYVDSDTNSLIIFFGVSYQALVLGDFKFAADYEALVTSAGTIWKRRFDALDTWQRDKMLKPAIAEKKKIVTEKKGTIKVGDKEKEVTAQEKFTVPDSPKVPPDLEGPRPTPPKSEIQRKFVADYKALMDVPSKKPAELTEKIFKLSGPQLVECVEAYLQASTAYGDKNERSLYIFYGTASLAIRKSDAYYSFRFASGIKTKGTLVAKRFDALNSTQQADLNKDIAIMKKRARILDDLKIAYFEKEKREPTLRALRTFEFVAKSDQFDAFSNVLDDLNRAFEVGQPDDLSARFDALSAVAFAKMEPLLFMTLLKHCREAKRAGTTLRHQVYWFMVGVLYLQTLKVRPEAYKDGFKEEEMQFLFDTDDTRDPYFADFSIRLQYLWRHTANVADYVKACKGYLGLLQFAGKIHAALVPMVEMAIVRGIVEKLQNEKPQVIEKIRIPINSRYDASKTLKIYQTIGKVFILWYDPKLGAYVEHEGFDGVLFRVDSYNWLGQVFDNDAIWGEVYRSTAFIQAFIPFLFELIGYLPDLITGGITGLAKSIVTNIVIEKATEELGLNSTAVQLALLGAGLIAHHVSPGKEGSAASHLDSEILESERGTAGKFTDGDGVRNRQTEPPPSGRPEYTADRDIRGTAIGGGNVIGEHGPVPYETLTEIENKNLVSGVETGGGGKGGKPPGGTNSGASAPSSPPPSPPPALNVPPATRQDLTLAEEQLHDADQRLKDAADTLERRKRSAGGMEDLLNDPSPKTKIAEVKKNLAIEQGEVEKARARYKNRKYEVRAAEAKVDRLTKELAARGELQPKLNIEWNLPDKPTKFRYKSVEAKSWRPDAYVGTNDNRQTVEKILNEDPNGELGKRLLQNGRLFPANVGDENFWKAHPEVFEMAHVLSKRERGREVYIVMTKARNRTFGGDFERIGGVFKEDAIVLQGIAIDKQSAVALGVPQSVIDRAPVIKFSK
ncbi:MAG TPA: hypothetical protein VN025_04750 [Candidatus Dormibacteraeota bacterium]|nr:hypothetical protein [Candidatus Dormibacteraeota bacterium]